MNDPTWIQIIEECGIRAALPCALLMWLWLMARHWSGTRRACVCVFGTAYLFALAFGCWRVSGTFHYYFVDHPWIGASPEHVLRISLENAAPIGEVALLGGLLGLLITSIGGRARRRNGTI